MMKSCARCGKTLARKKRESLYNFKGRQNCGRACAFPKDYVAKFRSMFNVGPPDACWPWLGGKTADGYGILSVNRTPAYAHRFAWAIAHGSDPLALKGWILHDCDNPSCVNPKHLILGDRKKNIGDMAKRGRRAGQRHALHKLTWKKVDYIRSLKHPNRQALARKFRVSVACIGTVIRGECWLNRSSWTK